jgi:ABC-2 type transport system ATP-binding protein
VFKAQWTSLFFAVGNAQPAMGNGGCPEYKQATRDPAQIASIPSARATWSSCARCTAASWRPATSTPPAASCSTARRARPSSTPRARKLPVLLVQGQRDTLFNPNDALTAYTRLRDAGAPVEMVWNWGGHGGYDSRPGECEVYGGGTGAPTPSPTGVGLEDCYLTAARSTSSTGTCGQGRQRPGFSWYRDWSPFAQGADGDFAADEQYGTARPTRPCPRRRSRCRAPTRSSRRAAGDDGVARIVNPPGGQPSSYTETSNFTGPSSNPRDPRPPYDLPGQAASFTSEPFPPTPSRWASRGRGCSWHTPRRPTWSCSPRSTTSPLTAAPSSSTGWWLRCGCPAPRSASRST